MDQLIMGQVSQPLRRRLNHTRLQTALRRLICLQGEPLHPLASRIFHSTLEQKKKKKIMS